MQFAFEHEARSFRTLPHLRACPASNSELARGERVTHLADKPSPRMAPIRWLQGRCDSPPVAAATQCASPRRQIASLIAPRILQKREQ